MAAAQREVSDRVHLDRLLAYKPIVSPKAKSGPARLNTKGKAPSGRNVGKLTDLLKMPLDVFCEVTRRCLFACTTNSCGVDCFVPPSLGYSSTRTSVYKDSRRSDVKKLGPRLDRSEAGDRHAGMPP